MDQDGGNLSSKKWVNSGYILKVESTGLVNGLDALYEKKKRGVQSYSKVWVLHNWKDGVDVRSLIRRRRMWEGQVWRISGHLFGIYYV